MTYPKYEITLTCEAGHSQTMTTEGMTEEMAKDFAGMLDGTSDWLIHKPGPESKIGKCNYPDCGKPFKATVEKIS